jgi:mannitol-1-/sugar-/sorbitol-6-/2-deoxyglucose-6-phosphatase
LTLPPVTSVILDMDGLLIDTEPAWRAAETAVFAALGVELSEADLLETTGVAIGEVVANWVQREPRVGGEGAELSEAELADQITGLVVAHVKAEGEPMAGVPQAIEMFHRHRLRLAIASSSPMRLIDAVCERLGLEDIEVRCSAFDVARGKPAPDVYLAAARMLGVVPASCLAIEDSPTGVLAAKAAGMRCLAVPDPLLAGDSRYREADLTLSSLDRLDEPALHLLGVLPQSGLDTGPVPGEVGQ